jgi:hypothetical protein
LQRYRKTCGNKLGILNQECKARWSSKHTMALPGHSLGPNGQPPHTLQKFNYMQQVFVYTTSASCGFDIPILQMHTTSPTKDYLSYRLSLSPL